VCVCVRERMWSVEQLVGGVTAAVAVAENQNEW